MFFVNELVELRRAGGGRLCHVVGLPSSDGETQLLKAVVNGMTAVVLRYYRVPDQQYHFWGELPKNESGAKENGPPCCRMFRMFLSSNYGCCLQPDPGIVGLNRGIDVKLFFVQVGMPNSKNHTLHH